LQWPVEILTVFLILKPPELARKQTHAEITFINENANATYSALKTTEGKSGFSCGG
jgi:hypothetical protein